jgi:hypothetical protein
MGFCHVITKTGIAHNCAYPTQVSIFVAHGHNVAKATHIFQVNLQ